MQSNISLISTKTYCFNGHGEVASGISAHEIKNYFVTNNNGPAVVAYGMNSCTVLYASPQMIALCRETSLSEIVRGK